MERRMPKGPVRKDPRKEMIKRMVEGSILKNVDPRDREDALTDMDARLAHPKTDAELKENVVGLVFASVCHDLEIEPALESWSDADLEIVVPTQAEMEAWEAAGSIGLPTGAVKPRTRRRRWSPDPAEPTATAAEDDVPAGADRAF
jgi:hypothetical protein